jgi:drug/metabolite transporter (DMT)-like permease
MLLAGVALAIHFIGLMQGLYQVSLGVALTIMSTGAIWVGLIGIFLLKQFLTTGQWTGLALGISGIVLYAYVGSSFEADNLAALLWLLASASFGAVYVVIGQKVRATMTNFAYVAVIFAVAAVVSLGYSLITQRPILVEQSSDWIGILLITFFGQILVHTVSNLYLKHGEAALLQLTTLIQIPLVAIIGWVIFNQRIGLQVIPALVLTIGGLVIYNLAQPRTG